MAWVRHVDQAACTDRLSVLALRGEPLDVARRTDQLDQPQGPLFLLDFEATISRRAIPFSLGEPDCLLSPAEAA